MNDIYSKNLSIAEKKQESSCLPLNAADNCPVNKSSLTE